MTCITVITLPDSLPVRPQSCVHLFHSRPQPASVSPTSTICHQCGPSVSLTSKRHPLSHIHKLSQVWPSASVAPASNPQPPNHSLLQHRRPSPLPQHRPRATSLAGLARPCRPVRPTSVPPSRNTDSSPSILTLDMGVLSAPELSVLVLSVPVTLDMGVLSVPEPLHALTHACSGRWSRAGP